MSCWALIPLKARALGKQRLAQAVSPRRRVQLIDEMFDHVLTVARACTAVDFVAVVTPEAVPISRGVQVLVDHGGDVNEVVDHAVRSLQARGAHRVAVLPADTPHLTTREIHALISASEPGGLAFAPDHHDRGTNAVCLALPSPFHFQYGPGSLKRHLAQAAALGLAAAVVRRPGLCFDVDEPADLAQLFAIATV